MLKKIKEFFMGKPAEVTAVAPYKVEAPTMGAPAKVAEITSVVEKVSAPVVDQVAVVVAAEASAVTAAPEKKTRKPRTPKAETAVKEKAPAKAKAPKLTVVKAEKKAKSKKA